MWGWLRKLFHLEDSPSLLDETARVRATNETKEVNAFYYEVAMMKLNGQFREIRSIDTRTTSYFTIGSAILPIVAGFLSSDQSPLSHSTTGKYALSLGFGFYILLATFYV
jgi:hypothetical protein